MKLVVVAVLAVASDPALPIAAQYGVLAAAGLALWRYFVSDIRAARRETHEVWDRLASTVQPVLQQVVAGLNHAASVMERQAALLEQAVRALTYERDAKEVAQMALLEERLRTATLRAELAEERARGHGGV